MGQKGPIWGNHHLAWQEKSMQLGQPRLARAPNLGRPPRAYIKLEKGRVAALDPTGRHLPPAAPFCLLFSTSRTQAKPCPRTLSTTTATPSCCCSRSHLPHLSTCWNKEEMSSMSCTCDDLGDAARCSAGRIGSGRKYNYANHVL